jgi:hypothetical protein
MRACLYASCIHFAFKAKEMKTLVKKLGRVILHVILGGALSV